jgi:hydroxymethylpyrimidine/phosphomethylpyrimidine kinase
VKIALTIAGSDPSGGAGLQADLKTFHQFGVFGTSVVTAVTIQNTQSVLGSHAVPADVVAAQLDAVVTDLPPAATKSGMLGTVDVTHRVAEQIHRLALRNYVLDPVMVATSGGRLLDPAAVRIVAQRLVPLATLVTPNLDEAAALTGGPVKTVADMERAAESLIRMGAKAALVKGGHLDADTLVDVFTAGGAVRRFEHPRIRTTSTHGTGCTLSAAITAGLALGQQLEDSVSRAIAYVQRALAAAPGLGHGHGPLQHRVDPIA